MSSTPPPLKDALPIAQKRAAASSNGVWCSGKGRICRTVTNIFELGGVAGQPSADEDTSLEVDGFLCVVDDIPVAFIDVELTEDLLKWCGQSVMEARVHVSVQAH